MATSSPATPLLVPPTPGDTTTQSLTLHDVKPPVPILNLWLYAGLALLLALLIAAFLAWLLHQRRRRRESPPALVSVPPHRRALDRLRAALDQLHHPKVFISLVSDTLRIYLEERFDLRAPERTSEEFLVELQTSPSLDPKQKELLADFLTQCDLVKFARYQPTESELRGLWDTAFSLVHETSPLATGSPNPNPDTTATTSPPSSNPTHSTLTTRPHE